MSGMQTFMHVHFQYLQAANAPISNKYVHYQYKIIWSFSATNMFYMEIVVFELLPNINRLRFV